MTLPAFYDGQADYLAKLNAMWGQSALAVRTDLAASGGAALVGQDDGREGLIYSTLAGSTAAAFDKASSLRQFWARVNSNARDVKLIVMGDSTGNEDTEWVYLLAQWLGTQVPTHSIKYRLYNASTGWPAATTLASGSGAYSIEVWNGSVAGSVAEDFEGSKEAMFWGSNEFDVVLVNLGHNYGTTTTESQAFMRFIGTVCNIRSLAPRADLLVTLQNPRRDTGGAEQTARMVAAWRAVAAQIGCGVIDWHSGFLALANPAAYMADTVHPNDLGQLHVCFPAAKHEFVRPLALCGAVMPMPSPLETIGRNYINNPRFAYWTAGVPNSWTLTNATARKETAIAEGSLYALAAVVGVSGTPVLTQVLAGAWLAPLRGKSITAVHRVRKPAGMNALAGRISAVSNNGSVSEFFTSNARGDAGAGGWTWEVSQIQVQTDAVSLTINCYLGGASGVDSGKEICLSEVGLFVGPLPLAISRDDEVSKVLSSWYSPNAVVKHPTATAETLTVTGSTVAVTAATPGLAGVDINLPQLIAGKTYRLTFTPTVLTGATQGYVFIRDGYNGGSSTIVNGGNWTVAGGVKTVDFTGQANPVSVWFGAGETGTAWTATNVDITQID